MVVIKGPVARAGSILYLFKINGTNVPNNAAKTMTVKRDIQTVMGNFGSGYKIVQIKNKIIRLI